MSGGNQFCALGLKRLERRRVARGRRIGRCTRRSQEMVEAWKKRSRLQQKHEARRKEVERRRGGLMAKARGAVRNLFARRKVV